MENNQLHVLEIRVHGVRDTREWESLGVAEGKSQVCQPPPPGSDDKSKTGFYCRMRDQARPELHVEGLHIEAYSWGALTSRTSWPSWAPQGSWGITLAAMWVKFREGCIKALWLLLAPFAFVNVAMWSRPEFVRAGSKNYAAAVMIRWAGLLLTALLIATVCGIAIDLLAWQCFRHGIVYCTATAPLSPVLAFQPAVARIAVAALVPALTLWTLWGLSHQSIRRYEAKRTFEDRVTDEPDPAYALRRPEFWRGESRTYSLLWLHLGLGICIISVAITAPIHAIAGSGEWPLPLWGAVILIPAIFACNAIGVLDQIEYGRSKRLRNLRRQGPRVLFGLAVLVLAVSYAWLLSGGHYSLDQDGQLPLTTDVQIAITGLLFVLVFLAAALFAKWWYAIIAFVIAFSIWLVHVVNPGNTAVNFGAVAGLLLAAYVAGFLIHLRSRAGDVLTWAWFGLGPVHLLVFAVFLGIMFSSVATLFSAAILGGRLNPAEWFPAATGLSSESVSGQGLTVPGPFLWYSTLFLPGLAVAALIALILRLCFRVRTAAPLRALSDAETLDADKPAAYKARYKAAFVHRIEALMGAAAMVPLTAGLLGTYAMLSGLPLSMPELSTWGLWAALGFGALVAVAVITAAIFPESRRSIGVLWDLSTFWPRTAHPFSPPCYGELVVPELVDRVQAALSGRTEKQNPCRGADTEASTRYDFVILSGHSLGSAILAAVILQLSDAEIERIRFVSYGSQLRAWFGRFFPDLLGPIVLGHEETAGATYWSSTPDAPQLGPSKFTSPDGSLASILRDGTHWRNFFRRTDPLGFRVLQDADNEVDRCLSDWAPSDAKPGKNATSKNPKRVPQTHGKYQESQEYQKLIHSWIASAKADIGGGHEISPIGELE